MSLLQVPGGLEMILGLFMAYGLPLLVLVGLYLVVKNYTDILD